MSIKSLLAVIAIIFAMQLQAQYPCFNGISTNPLNPINNQLPSKQNNFFNWQDSLWIMQPYPNCGRNAVNPSPFYQLDNLEELRESKDMKWEDGWELVRREVGLTQSNAYTVYNPEHLYIILYNKYTGIIRIILLACRKQDYTAARVELKFDGTSVMKTDMLEFSRDEIGALDKTYSLTQFAAGVKYINENHKYFYADFPMMYDPCTCLYKSKLYIHSTLISTGNIKIEGTIGGDIHTKTESNKAVVQKPGTYSWKDLGNTVNGRVMAVYGSVEKFRAATEELAKNIKRTDSAGKSSSIAQLSAFMKINNFLKSGLKAVPWLSSAISMVDVFTGRGKQGSATQEIKLLPLAINLTAKLSGTLQYDAPYHDIIFTNPGSKNAVLDPDLYPYYNEVLGVFNLAKTPVLYVQSNFRTVTDPQTGKNIRIKESRYRLDLDSIKYVLNPAAEVTIQNMKAAIVIEGQNREFNVCAYSGHVIPPDFVYEGKDGISNVDKYRTDYMDMMCLGSRMFQANSYYNALSAESATDPLPDVGCPDAFTSKGYIKFMINLKRNNTTPNTQNILFVATYPLRVKNDGSLPNYVSDYLCNDSSIIAPASVAEVNALCSSSVYYSSNRSNINILDPTGTGVEHGGFRVSPNPNNGNFTISLHGQPGILKAISVTDMKGREVHILRTGNLTLATGYSRQLSIRLPAGLYIVNCTTDKGILRSRMIMIN